MEIKYGEQEILDFNIDNEENFWPNKHEKKNLNYRTLPQVRQSFPGDP